MGGTRTQDPPVGSATVQTAGDIPGIRSRTIVRRHIALTAIIHIADESVRTARQDDFFPKRTSSQAEAQAIALFP